MLSTVSDRLNPIADASGALVAYYQPDITSAADYYPFGMQMPGRVSGSDLYRYGFNGKENDNEVKGQGNQVDFGNRILDVRLGKWLSNDYFAGSYPSYTPYNFGLNNPISQIDINGDFIPVANSDAKTDEEKKKQIDALTSIGNNYLKYLRGLNPEGKEAQALVSHSGFNSLEDVIDNFENGSQCTGQVLLMFSTQDGPNPSNHEIASQTPRGPIYFTHPNGRGGTTGAEARFSGNTITLSKHFSELYNYMNKKDYITVAPGAASSGLTFNYAADIQLANNYISQVISHEVTHWGAQINGMPTNVSDASNSFELLFGGIEFKGFNGASPMWERGQHYEWAAYGRTTSALQLQNGRMAYGAAVNIFYRTMSNFNCNISGPPPANQSSVTSAALRASLERDFSNLIYSNSGGSSFGDFRQPSGSDIHGY